MEVGCDCQTKGMSGNLVTCYYHGQGVWQCPECARIDDYSDKVYEVIITYSKTPAEEPIINIKIETEDERLLNPLNPIYPDKTDIQCMLEDFLEELSMTQNEIEYHEGKYKTDICWKREYYGEDDEFDVELDIFKEEKISDDLMEGTIYFLTHDDPVPQILHYDQIVDEEHFMNMIGTALLLAKENQYLPDKAFGYFNSTWYHALETGHEPLMKIPEDPKGSQTDEGVGKDIWDRSKGYSYNHFLIRSSKSLDDIANSLCGNKFDVQRIIENDEAIRLVVSDRKGTHFFVESKWKKAIKPDDPFVLTKLAIEKGFKTVDEVRTCYCKTNEKYDTCSVCSQWNRFDKCTLLKAMDGN